MRRWIGLTLGFIGLPALAFGQCRGTDQMAALAAADPSAYQAILSRGEAIPNGHGKFWQVTRAGQAPSFLFGTFHDTEIAAEPLDPAVLAAMTGARLMLVELSEAEQKRMQKRMAEDPTFAFDPAGPAISSRLSPADRAMAEAALKARGMSLAMIDHLRPAFLFSIVGQPQCAIDAMASGKPVLDAALMARATAAGVPVRGMERYTEALDSIDAIPRATLDTLLADALRNMNQLEDYRRTAVGLYRRGETGALSEFEIWSAAAEIGAAESRRLYDAFSGALIVRRNRAWMATMVPELERGGVFAAFGALHLPGAAGVVELLRAQGFAVTRLDG